MTTPAQYEAAIRALEKRCQKLAAYRDDGWPLPMWAELEALEAALAIVREAAERAGHGPAWNDLARRAQRREGTCPDCGWPEDDSLALEGHACPGPIEPTPLTPDPQR